MKNTIVLLALSFGFFAHAAPSVDCQPLISQMESRNYKNCEIQVGKIKDKGTFRLIKSGGVTITMNGRVYKPLHYRFFMGGFGMGGFTTGFDRPLMMTGSPSYNTCSATVMSFTTKNDDGDITSRGRLEPSADGQGIKVQLKTDDDSLNVVCSESEARG